MKSLKSNFVFNVIYQILVLIIPFITTPYISRVIGADGIGIYSYNYSIVNYFMLFCLLGVNNYGNRFIAKIRDDKDKLSKTFWSIYFCQLVMGIMLLVIYYIYVCCFLKSYRSIALIQSIFIFSAIFDINWLFFGLEEFKVTITKNIVVKLTSMVLIFLFVKSSDDLWIYTLILAGTTLLNQVIMWIYLPKIVKTTKINARDIIVHIKPNLILFIPVIAVSLYKTMDKVMLGLFSNMTEVGFYEQAEKIITVPSAVITALGTVMLPRMSNLVSKNETTLIKEYIEKSEKFMMFLALPCCLGLCAVADNFVTLFLGESFDSSINIVKLLSVTIIFISIANVIRTQYLIPNERDKEYIVSVFGGAMLNLVLNVIFIPKFAAIGACIGTIIAEFFVMFYQMISVRKALPVGKYYKFSIAYLIKSLLMYAIIYPIKFLKISSIYIILIQILLGCVIYAILNIKYILSILKSVLKK